MARVRNRVALPGQRAAATVGLVGVQWAGESFELVTIGEEQTQLAGQVGVLLE